MSMTRIEQIESVRKILKVGGTPMRKAFDLLLQELDKRDAQLETCKEALEKISLDADLKPDLFDDEIVECYLYVKRTAKAALEKIK